MKTYNLTPATLARFWLYVDKSGPCWLWRGAGIESSRHGVFWLHTLDGRETTAGAHVVAYCIYHGGVPDGLIVMHECDNGFCVTEKCLVAGTVSKNTQDAYDRGLIDIPCGEEHWNRKLAEGDIREIRHLYDTVGLSSEQIGREFCVARQTIRDITARRTWKHVD